MFKSEVFFPYRTQLSPECIDLMKKTGISIMDTGFMENFDYGKCKEFHDNDENGDIVKYCFQWDSKIWHYCYR